MMKKFPVLLASVFLVLSVPQLVPAAAIVVTAANVVPSGSAIYLPGDHYAATTITAGQAVYVNSSITGGAQSPTNPDVGLATASGAGDAVKPVGIAVTGGSAGQPIKVVIRDPSFAIGGTCAAGDVIYLHSTAGAITSTYADVLSTQYVCVFGVGNASGKINLGATTITGLGFAGVIRADVAK